MDNQHYDANFIEISREILSANAKAVVEAVKVPVIGVLKFDGYFIGITEAAKAWQSAGVSMFAVSESWEALALRREGFTEEILLMAPVADEKTLSLLFSNNAKAKPNTAVKITKQPTNAKAKVGEIVKTTVTATGSGLTYTWYVRNPSSVSWGKSSVTGKTYSCKMTSKVNGRYVYCVVTDKYGKTVKTSTVRVKMK